MVRADDTQRSGEEKLTGSKVERGYGHEYLIPHSLSSNMTFSEIFKATFEDYKR